MPEGASAASSLTQVGAARTTCNILAAHCGSAASTEGVVELRVVAALAAVDRIKASREAKSDSEDSAPEEAAPETLHSKRAKFFSKMSIGKQKEAQVK